MLDRAIRNTNEYTEQVPKTDRKKYGQFFTSASVAQFMAGLFDIPAGKTELSILDPGAGSGLLSIALLARLQQHTYLEHIHITCYETDPNVLCLLCRNLIDACACSAIPATFQIRAENYILAQADQYNGAADPDVKYDLVIGNPPYKKIHKSAPEVQVMADICHGGPNLYSMFAAMSLFNVADNGEMVYIIPRSWTSGPYFAAFRKKFLAGAVLERIHLFGSRNRVFDKESVLQETMIIKARKTGTRPDTVSISTSLAGNFSQISYIDVPYSTAVSDRVFLPICQKDIEVLQTMARWRDTLPSLGIQAKTGLVVDFRAKEYLRNTWEPRVVPVYYPRHIKDGRAITPEDSFITTERPSLLQPNRNYLFMRRTSTKEEPRQLRCGIYLAKEHPGTKLISTDLKINFVDTPAGLPEETVYGLYVLFSSSLYDRYYRIVNGCIHVATTEINAMPVPPRTVIDQLGRELMADGGELSVAACDRILARYVERAETGQAA